MKTGNKIFLFVIILLTLVNLGFVITVVKIWNSNNVEALSPRSERRARFMEDEIGFDKNQLDQFRKIRRDFRDNMRPMRRELHQLNHELILQSISDNPDTTACMNLARQIGKLNYDMKVQISRHLMEVSSISDTGQMEKLNRFYLEMFNSSSDEHDSGRKFRHRRGRNGE